MMVSQLAKSDANTGWDDLQSASKTRLLEDALVSYGFGELAALEQIDMVNWHKDVYYKALLTERTVFVRVLKEGRLFRTSPNVRLGEAMVNSQLETLKVFMDQDLPVNNLIVTSDEENYKVIEVDGQEFLVIVFEWQEGQFLKYFRPNHAHLMGGILGKMHALALNDRGESLPLTHGYELHNTWLNDIREVLNSTENTFVSGDGRIREHLDNAQQMLIECNAENSLTKIAVHADFNSQNVLWDLSGKSLVSIIDYDQIGMSSKVSDLAWVLKWYSRAAHNVDPRQLATAFIEAYKPWCCLDDNELSLLPSLMWLSSGLNYNFVLRVAHAASLNQDQGVPVLHAYCDKYGDRSSRLYEYGSYFADSF